jgi:drug/metabolite transporter (DMT)-like permease
MSKPNHKELLNWTAYLIVCIIWGSAYIAIKIGVTSIAPFYFTAIRFFVAGALMLIFAKVRGLNFPNLLSEYVQLGIVGLLILFGGSGFVGLASRYTGAGSLSLIIATTPLIMAIIQMIMTREMRNVSLRVWLGLLIGFTGVGLLLVSGGGNMSLDPRGIALALISVVLWCIGTLYSGTVQPRCHIVVQSGLQMLVAGSGLMIVSSITGESHTLNVLPESQMALLYLIVFGSIIAYSAYVHIVQVWPATKANTFTYINPMVAVLLGWMILKEPVTPTILMSMTVILSGVILVQTSSSNPRTVVSCAETPA